MNPAPGAPVGSDERHMAHWETADSSLRSSLDHTMEEELLHLNQNLQNETFGPGTAAAKEREVDAARKIPDPTKPN